MGPGERCSTWARSVGLDPIGSIGTYSGFLLVEWPGPWPADFNEIPELAPVVAMLSGTGVRLQGLVPVDGKRRVISYHRPEPACFAGYHRTERLLDDERPAGIARAVESLLAEPAGKVPSEIEVLVCTHGRRDVCCGSNGATLALELAAGAGWSSGTTVRWRRTSHTGGHRFAPTAVVLPQGTAWAFADAALLAQVTRGQGRLAPLLARYRGCAGLGSARVQALERAVLAEVGWELFDRPRWGHEVSGSLTRLEARHVDGSMDAWEATVSAGRELPIPDCGATLSSTSKTTIEWRVEGFQRVDA